MVVTAVAAWVVWHSTVRDTLVDDAYIYLSYARTLANGGGWAVISGLESNTATSTLFVLALAGVTAIVRDAVVAGGVLLISTFVLMAWGVHRLGRVMRVSAVFGWVAVAAVLVNPLIVSSSGLETQFALI